MSVRKDDIEFRAEQLELKRQEDEKVLTQEKRELWQSVDEIDAQWDSVKSVRAQEFSILPKDLEFKEGASTDEGAGDLSRRRFLQFSTAASTLLAATACQRRPVDHLVPYVHKPAALTYGVPQWYATSASNGYGILVKTREGKPIKIEGNPDHPVNQGGLDAGTQASLFNLYNPERLKAPTDTKTGVTTSWAEVSAKANEVLATAPAGSVRVLTGPMTSPTARQSLNEFISKTKAIQHSAENISSDSILDAAEIVTGDRVLPTIHFDKADVVLSVDADFLGTWLRPVEFTKGFSKRRKLSEGQKDTLKLYSFESIHSITGVASDGRWSITPSQQLPALIAIGSLIAKSRSNDAASVLRSYSAEKIASEAGLSIAALQQVAADLVSAAGKSVVVSGLNGPRALETQIVTLLINAALGNVGSTLDFDRPMIWGTESGQSFETLVADMKAGKVQFLLVHGINPVYSKPNSGFKEALAQVKWSGTLTPELNETAAVSQWALPESHYLESWGDSEIRDGVYSIQQAVIEPLYQTKSFGELLHEWAGGAAKNYRDVVMANWQKFSKGDFRNFWNDQLKTGALTGSASNKKLSWKWANASNRLDKVSLSQPSGVQLALYSSNSLRDGTDANNPYLQELPDPITKVTWDNFVGVSPKMAAKLNLNANHFNDPTRETPKILASDYKSDMLEISFDGKKITLPVYVQPGLHENVVVVALGYGRARAGSVGTDIGRNAFVFTGGNDGALGGQIVALRKTGDRYELACTQKHFQLQGRDNDILHQYNLKEYLSKRSSGESERPETFSIYPDKEFVYPGSKWGMAIDLNSCTGCNACVVSCYTENNVSTVGRDQVILGRHQAWLRLDLYHSGSAENPESSFEPMMCQHCDLAPCETVCPVLATVHSSDGLNDMSYNRCVGTRYCANNCPYKVRRFNWFQYSDKLAYKVEKKDPLPMLINPDVSVRTRGVMEKCTFCVQRIRAEQQNKMAQIPDGHVKTACQQSCPADAIVFGDLNDPKSEVSRLAKASGSFKVLEVLNTQPNVTYLPRVRNKEASA